MKEILIPVDIGSFYLMEVDETLYHVDEIISAITNIMDTEYGSEEYKKCYKFIGNNSSKE